MNRIHQPHYGSFARRPRPRMLFLAVLATLPGMIYAQQLPPLQTDPRLLGNPGTVSAPGQKKAPATSQSEPAATASAPVAATKKQTAEAAQDKAGQPASVGAKRSMVIVPPKNPQSKRPEDLVTTTVEADNIDGHVEVDMTAEGSVHVVRGALVLDGDKVYYDQVANEVTAEGNVRFTHGDDAVAGPRAHMNLDTWYGEFDSPTYRLKRRRKLPVDNWPMPGRPVPPSTVWVTGSGAAERIKLEGENHYRLSHSTYTTCEGPDPSWYLRMSDLKLDFDRDKGQATHSLLFFKDVPIAYFPWGEFPLSGGRQSGFLPPTIGASNNTGFDTSVPYYFNIAPNYDATLAPRYMSERGLQMGGEARYLTSQVNGVLRGEYLEEDKVTQTSRSLIYWKHNQNFGYGLTGAVDAEQVSDKTYFADLSSKIVSTSQSTLNQQASLNYNNGSWLTGSAVMQRYQVLSGDTPYSRRPQLTLQAQQNDFHGLALSLPVEYTDFSHPTADEGRRLVMYPQISYPMQTSSFFFTPKMGVHMLQYDITRRTSTGDSEINYSIPTVSLDSGLIFERDTTVSDKAQVQTLEPRVYYVHTAYRDQSQIPVFDTSVADFNFAQIFSENRYVGKDRVSDSNQVTAGVQSRMIDSATGEEWLRTALAQRYYFADQRVVLPSETVRTGRVANLLGSVSGRVVRNLWSDTALEYDQRDGIWQRATTQFRYQPDLTKVTTVGYRFDRSLYRDVNISSQWPLWGKLYGVGRYDLNLRDHRLSEAIAGLEYKGDCWVLRTVWQSLLTTSETRNNSFYLQLEFGGLAGLGNNPVNLLKRSVNGYGKINDPAMGDQTFGDNSSND